MLRKSKSKAKGVAYYKKQADKHWSLYIRHRDGEQRPDGWYAECITCGEWRPLKTMQCGHFQRRSYNIIRYDEENTNAQCYTCNILRYGEQYKYAQAVDKKYGNGTADKLVKLAKTEHKLSVSELQEIINTAQAYIYRYTRNI